MGYTVISSKEVIPKKLHKKSTNRLPSVRATRITGIKLYGYSSMTGVILQMGEPSPVVRLETA